MIPSFLRPGARDADSESFPFVSSLFCVPSPAVEVGEPFLAAWMRLGGSAKTVAPRVFVELRDANIAVFRSPDGERLAGGAARGVVVRDAGAAAVARADASLRLGCGEALKLWLPEDGEAARRWRLALLALRDDDDDGDGEAAAAAAATSAAPPAEVRSRMRESRGFEASAASEGALTALAAALAADALPEGWARATDGASGREYFYARATGETRWTVPGGDEGAAAAGGSTPATGDVAFAVSASRAWEDADGGGDGAERPPPRAAEIAAGRDLVLRDALRADLDAFLDAAAGGTTFTCADAAAAAPFWSAFFEDAKECPLLSDSDSAWAAVVDAFAASLPALAARAEGVAGADARAHLVEAVAEPVAYLSEASGGGRGDLDAARAAADAAEAMEERGLEIALSEALRHARDAAGEGGAAFAPAALEALVAADDSRELPGRYRSLLDALRAVLLARGARALADPQRRAALRGAYRALPRRSISALARLGLVPSSRAFCATLAGLFVLPPPTGGPSVMQRLARQSLGVADAVRTRDAALRAVGHSALAPAAVASMAAVEDRARELENPPHLVPTPLHEKTPATAALTTLEGERRRTARRALDVEAYRRKAERLVDAYASFPASDFVTKERLPFPPRREGTDAAGGSEERARP